MTEEKKNERGREGEENHMNRMKCFTRWAMAIVAVGLALSWAPASRAAGETPETAATQPAPAATATAQPAAAQPTADQRLEELEKQMALLEEEIASLKTASAAEAKMAANPEPAAAPRGEDAAKISLAGLLGNVTLSGFGDVYYGYDNNHPFNNLAGLRNFEAPTNGFNFNMAEFILDKAPDAMSSDGRLGYHLAVGYGTAAKVVNGSDNTGFGDGSNFYLKEAYLSYLAPVGKGLTVTVGKFVTPIGAEVIESNANWNYSRGLLFYYAIPYFHFGASAKYAFNSKLALTGYLVNGWNNTIINHAAAGACSTSNFSDGFMCGQSAGLTYGASLAYTPTAKWSVTENYFAGPVVGSPFGLNDQTITDWKQLSDTVISYTPNSKWAFILNGDYGFGPRNYDFLCDLAVTHPRPQGGPCTVETSPAVDWWGVAGYAKYNWTPKTNFAVRYEYYDDPQGYTGLIMDPEDGDTGFRGWAQEITGTYSYNLTSALLIRGEYRYDFASLPMFVQSFSNDKFVKEQNTATISFVYSFSSANAK